MALTVATRSWAEVVAFYRDLVDERAWDFGPMLTLVEFITSSPYSSSIFPATSLAKLCIARTPILQWEREMLAVEYDPTVGHFVFTYFEASRYSHPWVTRSSADEGRARFEHLLKNRLRWFEMGSPEIRG